jgi:hypothetical protein
VINLGILTIDRNCISAEKIPTFYYPFGFPGIFCTCLTNAAKSRVINLFGDWGLGSWSLWYYCGEIRVPVFCTKKLVFML